MEKLEISISIKNGIGFCAVYFCLTLLIKMCFLISIFLCFALVPKLVPRTVDFHWYWYRILTFWYRDNPTIYKCLPYTTKDKDRKYKLYKLFTLNVYPIQLKIKIKNTNYANASHKYCTCAERNIVSQQLAGEQYKRTVQRSSCEQNT